MRLLITDATDVKLKQYLLYLGVSVFVTTLFWIGYSVYDAYTKPFENPEVEQLLTPLNPSLDNTALALLVDRYTPPENFPIMVVRDGVPGIIPPGGGQESTFAPVATSSANSEAGITVIP